MSPTYRHTGLAPGITVVGHADLILDLATMSGQLDFAPMEYFTNAAESSQGSSTQGAAASWSTPSPFQATPSWTPAGARGESLRQFASDSEVTDDAHMRVPLAQAVLEVKRSGLASMLFAIVRPRDPKAISLRDNTLKFRYFRASKAVPLGDINYVHIQNGRNWSQIRIDCVSGQTFVPGLPRHDTESFAAAVQIARVDWWRGALADKIQNLAAVHNRLQALQSPSKYLSRSALCDLTSVAERAANKFVSHWPASLSSTAEIKMLNTIQEFLNNPERFKTLVNKAFIAEELKNSRDFFDHVEALPLTCEQRRAVILDEDRNLVLASAGSGKTSVIVAKAGWLIRKGYCRPSEILLLAFGRNAKNELAERIGEHLGDDAAKGITVRTFHSLGRSIVGKVEDQVPTLAKVAEDNVALLALLKNITEDLLAKPKERKVLVRWFQNEFAPYRRGCEFKNLGEYWEYIRRHEIRSLQGERVKSFEECRIANFLYLNGVPYEYEAPYEKHTATQEKSQYKPDFYLRDVEVYIEHFGLNALGQTAEFVDQEKYLDEMEWKKRQHAKNGTTLIQTFSCQQEDGSLLRTLAERLIEHGVTLSPIPADQIFSILNKQNRIDPFTRLVATFLEHYKGANLTWKEVERRAERSSDRRRASAFLSVFKPIYEQYQETLSRLGQIDFNDMIIMATEHVEAEQYRSPYNYILVDEFQDISPGRARLIRALLDRTPTAKLLAVGDDWQAIYRFAGSDVTIMWQFQRYFGYSERVHLTTTFRCNDHIASIARKFVLNNPKQLHKRVRSTRQAQGPSVYIGLSDNRHKLLGEALGRIASDAARSEEKSSVLILGRYNHNKPENISNLGTQYPSLKLSYKTIHGSKGLESNYVVVLGMCSGRYGFPAEISDDPILELVLADPEEYPNAEERRLLYVAMTRARRQVFLLADSERPSSFVLELDSMGYDVTVFGQSYDSGLRCPTCEGYMRKIEHSRDGSTFYGCSNYPYCSQKLLPCSSCKIRLPVRSAEGFRCRGCDRLFECCPKCEYWLDVIQGKHGPFLGCSTWPKCDYKRSIPHT